MPELHTLFLTLDHLHFEISEDAYDQANHSSANQKTLPGFTLVYAVERGTGSAGEGTYQHGGLAYVLLSLQKYHNK
jgi:hypothetical protein